MLHLQYLCEAQCERKVGIRSDSEHSWAGLLPDNTKVEDDDDVYENQIDENSAKSAFSFTNARQVRREAQLQLDVGINRTSCIAKASSTPISAKSSCEATAPSSPVMTAPSQSRNNIFWTTLRLRIAGSLR